MRTQHTESVISSISFNSGHQTTVNEDQVEQAGQSILSVLDKAAAITEANRQRATDVEQKLTYQLRTASQRIANLEAAVAAQQQRADRAEQWLHTIYTEIEERFLRKNGHRTGTHG
jgi:chromosome segregation ATPase